MQLALLSFVAVLAACTSHAPAKQQPSWYVTRGYTGFGTVVAAAGDVDGDGSPDIAVADTIVAPDASGPMVWIVSAKDGKVIRTILVPPFENAICRIEGGHDVDGDGVPDLLISAATLDGSKSQSVVQLISGATGKTLRTFAAHTTRRDSGEWARFVRDVDGDGADDVAMLASNEKATARTLIVSSSRTGTELLRIPVDRSCGDGPAGLVEVAEGYVVLLDGDLHHVAFAQLLSRESKKALWEIEAPPKFGSSSGVLASLRGDHRVALGYEDCVEVVESTTGNRLQRFEPQGKTDCVMGFGASVAAMGDVNADGVGDLAIAETEDCLFVGAIHAKSGKSADELWTARPESDDDVRHLGRQLAAIGDVDGDSISDLVVGTCEIMACVPGRALIVSGKTGKTLRQLRRSGDSVVVMPPTPKSK